MFSKAFVLNGSSKVKDQDLVAQFLAYSATNPVKKAATAHDPIAILIPKDRVKVSENRSEVMFNEAIGWMPVGVTGDEGDTDIARVPEDFDWIAVWTESHQGETAVSMVVGQGSPFSPKWKDVLPTVEGTIRAMPETMANFGAVQEMFTYDTYFREKVRKGREQMKRGEILSDKEVNETMRQKKSIFSRLFH